MTKHDATPLSRFKRAIAPRVSLRPDDCLPEVLYHYTNAIGLVGIIRDGSLRATNFSYLNDPSEVQYGRELAKRLLDERFISTQDTASRGFLQRVTSHFNLEMLAEVYVCSFTELGDDLSQWRAYGTSSSERFSIGFDTEPIQTVTFGSVNTLFDRVRYDEGRQHAAVGDLLDRSLKFVTDSPPSDKSMRDSFAAAVASRLAGIVPTLKNPTYSAEREWRVVIWPDHRTRVQFDVTRGVVRPFIELSLPAPLPIISLHVLAPTRRDLAVKAAALLLETAKIEVTPKHSSIPFAE